MMKQQAFVHITVAAAAVVVWDLLGWIGNSRRHLFADAVWTTAGGDVLAQQLHHSLH
jgi:hypothetical protein